MTAARFVLVCALALGLCAASPSGAQTIHPVETPMFRDDVAAGKLPPGGQAIARHTAGRAPRRSGDRARQAGRDDEHADRPQPRCPDAGRLRILAAGRLRPESRTGSGHSRRHRGQRRPRVHAEAAQGAPLVGWKPLHDRGLPLLLGGCGEQRGVEPGRAAARPAGRRRAAEVRGPRRDHGALFVVEAQPRFPAAHRGCVADVHLSSRAIPQALPQEIHAEGRRGGKAGQGEAGLGGGPQQAGQHVPVRQSQAADAGAVGEYDRCARRALRGGPQSVFSPRRPAGPPAALCRPRDHGRRRKQADPGQDRRR